MDHIKKAHWASLAVQYSMALIPLLLLIGAFAVLWMKTIRSKKHPPLPPGPPAEPIIGHLRVIPSENQESVFHEWGKVYGDVISLHALGSTTIILNSVEPAVDLLEKRSRIYSDRPRLIVMEILGWVRSLPFLPYGKIFQKHRRMFNEYLSAKKCIAYQPLQTRETHILLQNLLSDEKNHDNSLKRFAAAIIIRSVYGHHITSNDDSYIHIVENAINLTNKAGAPGNTAVDFFPFLQYFPSWFPGTYYATYARENRKAVDKMHQYPYEQVKKAMDEGKARPSFLSHHLEAMIRDGSDGSNDILDIQGAAGTFYGAGAETTHSTLSFFFLAMVIFPEVQVRAQKEIDGLLGGGRLPEFADRSALPYVDCILQETTRWYSVFPLGIPHRSMEDDIYRGMFIPKGSLIIANIRAMMLDEKVYSNPHTFNPSRYLPEPEGSNEPYPNGPFGFGRRICPGRHLADASLWLAIASILASFNISKAMGEDGKEITPEVSIIGEISCQPSPFQCRIRPRHEQARRLIIGADVWDSD